MPLKNRVHGKEAKPFSSTVYLECLGTLGIGLITGTINCEFCDLVSSPDPAPKRRRKGLGTGEHLLALDVHADTARAKTNLRSDWLIGSAVAFLWAASMLKLIGLPENC